ncbi:hypothetical protein ACIB24_00960 [Spongisporangium articulatum]|uniref:PE domain-containing protein n=1 Tax=Spongisporangium articulatum TaxID=3362603 RepID=A0ABW8AH01_9ACTN
MSFLRVDTESVLGLVAALRAAQAEARAVARSPQLLCDSFTAAGAGPEGGAVAGAGAAFVAAWGEALDDATHQLEWVASAFELVVQAYEGVESAVTDSLVGRSVGATG